ncbi:MAG: hypothetical protein COT17_01140 [Elusimicrobia bacterium CG08_land_8_20_14_0_20_51_18]|nr:MAG: hypothetical protein COT17_01140 [Elusimicrobia bacterium CG08_land_8_20_14_0_20_51_18]
MNLAEIIRTALLEIKNHKMRSFLSFFAISIGVISIMYTLTLIYSMNYRLKKAVEVAGPGRLNIELKNRWEAQTDVERKQANDTLTYEDALSIRKIFPELYMVSPYFDKWVSFSDGYFREHIGVRGITTEWRKRGWVYKMRGRFINRYDIENNQRVCVVIEDGGWLKKPKWLKFWSFKDPFQNYIKHNELLGKTIKLGSSLYKVVGILKEPPGEKNPKTFIGIGMWEPKILAPISTAQRFLGGWSQSEGGIDGINVDTGREETISKYQRLIEQVIKARHGRTMLFSIKDYREIIKDQMADKHRDMMTVMIIGIIAILAGGIGIMNVSLATIYSRIKEIGIRRAIGATRWDIMRQFMIEAMMLGFFGGIAGVIVGFAGIEYLAMKGDTDMMMLRWWMALAAICAAVLTGFLASIYPARSAARLDPIDALRYE